MPQLKEIPEQAKQQIDGDINKIYLEISKKEKQIFELIVNKLPEKINWELVDMMRKGISDLKVEKKAIEFTQSIYEPENRKLRNRIKILEGTLNSSLKKTKNTERSEDSLSERRIKNPYGKEGAYWEEDVKAKIQKAHKRLKDEVMEMFDSYKDYCEFLDKIFKEEFGSKLVEGAKLKNE